MLQRYLQQIIPSDEYNKAIQEISNNPSVKEKQAQINSQSSSSVNSTKTSSSSSSSYRSSVDVTRLQRVQNAINCSSISHFLQHLEKHWQFWDDSSALVTPSSSLNYHTDIPDGSTDTISSSSSSLSPPSSPSSLDLSSNFSPQNEHRKHNFILSVYSDAISGMKLPVWDSLDSYASFFSQFFSSSELLEKTQHSTTSFDSRTRSSSFSHLRMNDYDNNNNNVTDEKWTQHSKGNKPHSLTVSAGHKSGYNRPRPSKSLSQLRRDVSVPQLAFSEQTLAIAANETNALLLSPTDILTERFQLQENSHGKLPKTTSFFIGNVPLSKIQNISLSSSITTSTTTPANPATASSSTANSSSLTTYFSSPLLEINNYSLVPEKIRRSILRSTLKKIRRIWVNTILTDEVQTNTQEELKDIEEHLLTTDVSVNHAMSLNSSSVSLSDADQCNPAKPAFDQVSVKLTNSLPNSPRVPHVMPPVLLSSSTLAKRNTVRATSKPVLFPLYEIMVHIIPILIRKGMEKTIQLANELHRESTE